MISLYKELLKNKKVLSGITDAVFKRIMMNHKEYLDFILERSINISSSDIVKRGGEFLNNELQAYHMSLKLSRMDLVLKVDNYYINLESNTTNDIHYRN